MTETICAIATPPGRGGVGVVRISGTSIEELANRLIGRLPEARRASLVEVSGADGQSIDRGLALYFPAPASFTGEHVLEMQLHGSPVVLEMVLCACVAAGARRAGPGEFSQRAFVNDKLDLAQAEAIADLIAASSEQAARAASRSLEGVFSSRVHALADATTELRVYVEAALDFPDEEIDFLAEGDVLGRVRTLLETAGQLLADARAGKLLNDGFRIAIVGKPNAGKSSLFNALLKRDAAIVTEIPGTTRDVVRETRSPGRHPGHAGRYRRTARHRGCGRARRRSARRSRTEGRRYRALGGRCNRLASRPTAADRCAGDPHRQQDRPCR